MVWPAELAEEAVFGFVPALVLVLAPAFGLVFVLAPAFVLAPVLVLVPVLVFAPEFGRVPVLGL